MVHESSLGWLTTFSLSLSSLSTLSLLCVFVCGVFVLFCFLAQGQDSCQIPALGLRAVVSNLQSLLEC